MTKRPRLDPSQLDFGFGVPEAATADGMLADLTRHTAQLVAEIIRGDRRSRYEIAADVSRLLDQDVSKAMLDKYSSPASEEHRIPFDRMLALVAATGRYDLLRSAMRRIGADLLVGEEVYLAEIGHLESQKKAIDSRLKMLKAEAKPLDRGERRK